MALAPLQVLIPERQALPIPPRLVKDGTAAGRQVVVTASVAVTATLAAETIVALGGGAKILLRLR